MDLSVFGVRVGEVATLFISIESMSTLNASTYANHYVRNKCKESNVPHVLVTL